MKRVKNIGVRIVFLFVLFSILTGITGSCQRRYSRDMVIMFTQVFHAVPGTRSINEHSIEGELIETDDYGRMRFSFWTGSVKGICIMQKHDDKCVYYYDNVCYLISEPYKEHTSEELDAFKEANDWNEPMNESKMIKRELAESTLVTQVEEVYEKEELLKIFNSTVPDNEKYWTVVGYFDSSQDKQQLFIVSRSINKSTTGGYKYVPLDQYFMILNADGTYDPENYLIKVDDLRQSNSPLTEIKERNGWVG